MGVTYSYEFLGRVLYFDHGPARPADAYLRESVEQVPPREGDPNPGPPLWRADEVHVRPSPPAGRWRSAWRSWSRRWARW